VIDKQTELYREAKRLRDEEKKDLSRKSGRKDEATDGTVENIVMGVQKHHISESESRDDEKCKEKKNNVSREIGKQGDTCKHSQRNITKQTETSSSEMLQISTKSASSNNDQSEKVSRLMALLDRRKHLLGELVQDETVQAAAKVDRTTASTDRPGDEEKIDEDLDDSCNQLHSEEKGEEKVNVQTNSAVICENATSEKKTSEAITEVSDARKKKKKLKENITTAKISYLDMICELMKEWVSVKTLSFVNCQGEEEEARGAGTSTEMEAKIRDLCRRVDQQEATLDDIIGNLLHLDDIIGNLLHLDDIIGNSYT
jgi:hypothetical protein